MRKLLLLICFIPALALAQPNIAWWRTYDNNGGDERFRDIYYIGDEGFVCCGSSDDSFWLLRLDENGDEIWSEQYLNGAEDAKAYSVIQSDQGEFLAGGLANDSFSAILTSDEGELIWSNNYGVAFVVRNANESILVVHSNIPVMTFEANMAQDEPLPGMVFVDIPAGTFTIGSPINEKGREIDEKQMQVTLNGFQMMTTEVTQAMWVALMGDNPSYWKGDNLPVEQVSWNDCKDFIIKLNQRDSGKNYRLPSEAEWEYACRAGTTTRFHSGDQNSDLDLVGWYDENSNGKPHPVGQKQPNVWGLYDMHGNVFEWCQDWYSSYARPRDSS